MNNKNLGQEIEYRYLVSTSGHMYKQRKDRSYDRDPAGYMPWDEFIKYLDYLEEKKDWEMYLFALMASTFALRVSDVLKRRWSDFDGDVFIFKERKTKNQRRAPVPENFKRMLRKAKKHIAEWVKLRHECDLNDYIFFNYFKGKPKKRYSFHHRVKRTVKASGVIVKGNPCSHMFRKTFGRRMYDLGTPLEKICKAMGHSSPAVTFIYLGLQQEEIDEMYRDFDMNLDDSSMQKDKSKEKEVIILQDDTSIEKIEEMEESMKSLKRQLEREKKLRRAAEEKGHVIDEANDIDDSGIQEIKDPVKEKVKVKSKKNWYE